MKKVVAACIDKILLFDTYEEGDKYLSDLERRGKDYKLLLDCKVGNGRKLHVQEQYNNSPMSEG